MPKLLVNASTFSVFPSQRGALGSRVGWVISGVSVVSGALGVTPQADRENKVKMLSKNERTLRSVFIVSLLLLL